MYVQDNTVCVMSSSSAAAAVSVVTDSLLDAVREDCRKTRAELDRALRDAEDIVDPLAMSEDDVHERLFTKYVRQEKTNERLAAVVYTHI